MNRQRKVGGMELGRLRQERKMRGVRWRGGSDRRSKVDKSDEK